MNEIQLFLSNQSPDILCLSEHWLSNPEAASFSIPPYCNSSIYCRDTSYGGVANLSKPELNITPIFKIHDLCIGKVFECTAVSWILPKSHFIILSIYRPPCGDLSIFLDKLETVLSLIAKQFPNAEILACGDFNIDLLQPSNARSSFLDVLSSFNMFKSISTPTRITSSSSTLLDNIMTILDPDTYKTDTIDSDLSDHHAI
jgi:exonuclease III